MLLSNRYVKAKGERISEAFAPVPAPYMRRSFMLDELPETAELAVSGLGFYRVWINGVEITRSYLAPYISSLDDYRYFDGYEIAKHLKKGKNTVGFLLGCGIRNCVGGYVWDFDDAYFRGAPCLAFRLAVGSEVIEADEKVLCYPSPLLSDDLRLGEDYDARLEIPGWNLPEFDDSTWESAEPIAPLRGEARLADVEPIRIFEERKPTSITKTPRGYTYDFGLNQAGTARLHIKGEAGQTVEIYFGERLYDDGTLDIDGITFCKRKRPDLAHMPQYNQRVRFTCSGGDDVYEPSFTYFGYRYAEVIGITEEQATDGLLTYLVMHSDLPAIGRFETSDATVMALEDMTRRADEANFFFFPTDCPHREKNGWTADAALSAVQLLYKYDASRSWREWLRNIRAAMREDGSLPGIIPTAGWGFEWGNGPAWDSVLFELPYRLYTLRGDTEVICENAAAFMRYLTYIRSRRDRRGLLAIGLGDWCAQRRPYRSPLIFTDTVVSMDLARKAYEMLSAVGLDAEAEYAYATYEELRDAARRNLIDLRTMTAVGRCQTSQAMAIYYGVFDEAEARDAFKVLLEIIASDNEEIMAGVLGARVLFRVLGDYGETELAWRMITGRGRRHYGEWVEKGLTALAEDFGVKDQPHYVDSLNHHFWGDVSAFFCEYYAGVRYNPDGDDLSRLDIRPTFPKALADASFTYASPIGEIVSKWTRGQDGVITLTLSVPTAAHGFIETPIGFRLENGMSVAELASGSYRIVESSEG